MEDTVAPMRVDITCAGTACAGADAAIRPNDSASVDACEHGLKNGVAPQWQRSPWCERGEQRRAKVRNREAEKFWPEKHKGDHVDMMSFLEFLDEVETYLSALVPGLVAPPRLEYGNELEHDGTCDWNLKRLRSPWSSFYTNEERGSSS